MLKDEKGNLLCAEVHDVAAIKMIVDQKEEEEVKPENFDQLSIQKKKRIQSALINHEIYCRIITINEKYGDFVKAVHLLHDVHFL